MIPLIFLDTSFLIRALVTGSLEDTRLRAWLRERVPIGISAICWTEFLCGPLSNAQITLAERIVGSAMPFMDTDAVGAAILFNRTGRRRGSLVDCMVAAAAVRVGAKLATSNPKDFRRFEASGLQLAEQ